MSARSPLAPGAGPDAPAGWRAGAGTPPPAETLPLLVSGSRSPIWWGVLFLVVIEATAYASLIVAYFYLRLAAPEWPLGGIRPPELRLPTVATGLLVASAMPAFMAERAIRGGRRRGFLLGFGAGMILAVAYAVLSLVQMRGEEYTWAANAYGSIVWTINGYSLLHAVTLVLLAAVVAVLGWRGHFDERRHVGVQATALYWYFVALGSLPLYGTVYWVPRL